VKWKAAYLESRILSADPVELICILYEHAILSVQVARDSIERRDIASRSKAISKAIAIIGELESSLNHGAGGEVAGNLARLYQYIRERLLAANSSQEAGPLVEVERLLKTVGEAWTAIRPEADAFPAPARDGEIPPAAWGVLPVTESLDTHTAHSWSA
jgi:flagellar protein FliS